MASHIGTLTGNDAVLDAAFRRVGVLLGKTIEDLYDMAEVLSKQPRPKGPRLALVTNAGGPGVLATDMLVSEGGKIATLSEESLQKLNEILPSHWSRNNPIDILGDADVGRYGKAIETILGSSIDPQFGPVLLFGSGGQLVDVMKDYFPGLPPLNATLARRLMEQTLIFTALKGVRGRDSVNLAQLESTLVQFSRLAAEQPWIKEIDINPFVVSAKPMLALDARIGRKEGVELIFGLILPDNYGMQRVSKKVGFTLSFDRLAEMMRAALKL